MGENITHAFAAAEAHAIKNRKGGGLMIPVRHLDRISAFRPSLSLRLVGLSYAPLGIAVSLDGRVGIADYEGPAAKIYGQPRIEEVEVVPGSGKTSKFYTLPLVRDLGRVKVPEWPENKPLPRLFTKLPTIGSDKSRTQGVAWSVHGPILWQNGETDCFWRYEEQAELNGGLNWILRQRVELSGDTSGFMESGAVHGCILYVVRSHQDGRPAWLTVYDLGGTMIKCEFRCPAGSFIYGPGFKDGRPYFITDVRSDLPHGIYHEDKLVLPGVTGNDLAFLPDGSALVTQYNAPKYIPNMHDRVTGYLIL